MNPRFENARLYRDATDVIWNRGELDRIGEYVAHDYAASQTVFPSAGPGGLRRLVEQIHAAFSDFRYDLDEVIAERDLIAARWTLSGRHRGLFHGMVATGRAVRLEGMSFNRVRDGRIVEGWIVWDLYLLIEQLAGRARPMLVRSSPPPASAPAPVDASDVERANVAAYRDFVDRLWNRFDLTVLEERISAEYTGQDAIYPRVGRAGLRSVASRVRSAFSGFHLHVDDVIAEGDQVAARWTITGRQTGEFQGIPPTGRPIRMMGISAHRFRDGQITEGWILWDMYLIIEQLTGAEPIAG